MLAESAKFQEKMWNTFVPERSVRFGDQRFWILVGIIAGLATYAFMLIFSLRFTLYFPALWKPLPTPLKNFVSRQALNPKEKAMLLDLGGGIGGATATSTAEA